MAQTGKLVPHLSQQSTWELNLTVLQRMDHHVEEILITAGHVTLYEFDVDKCQWSRKDVEGSLFVVKRRTKPRFQFIVMNRRSTENLVEDLLDDFEYEVQLPYLLYRNAAQEVNGIWFYNSRECEEVAKLFSRISTAYSKIPSKRKVFSPQSDEFRELEAVPTAATVEGPLEPTSAPSAAGASEDPLERFFNNVLHLNGHESVAPTGVQSPPAMQPHSSAGNVPTFPPVLATPPPCPPPPPPPPPLPPSTNQPAGESGNTNPEVLLKPYFFVPPPLPQPATLHPLPPLQPSLGAPLLQPFPPPAPPPSLAPVLTSVSASANKSVVISRDGIHDALNRLVQNEDFVNMVYEEMLKAHKMSM